MIRFKNVDYSQPNKFSFNVDNKIIIGENDLSNNTRYVYTKLAKYYNVKGLSRYKKDDLIQKLVDEFGYEYIPTDVPSLETKMSNLNLGINNPIDELNNILSKNTNLDKYQEDSLRASYIYRIWLWNNHNTTYEDEMIRVNNLKV